MSDKTSFEILDGGKKDISLINPYVKKVRMDDKEGDKYRCINGRRDHGPFILYSEAGVVECETCKKQVEAIEVVRIISDADSDTGRARERLSREMDILRRWKPLRKSIIALEGIWQKRNVKPCCPHCENMIEPGDLLLITKERRSPFGGREYDNTRERLIAKFPEVTK